MFATFVSGVINFFGDEYLRRPTPEDLQRLLYVAEERGFPGMVGSIDCMHWVWKNFPTAWKGMYTRGSGKPTIVLEAVASYDLWIWHAFFGSPGTFNDINVLDRSPVFDDILYGQAQQVTYYVNAREYNLTYYLTDGVYPKWLTFIQSIPLPQSPKASLFAEREESARKDIECAFGVLQAIFTACIILHNMIVENERDGYTQADVSDFPQGDGVDLSYSINMASNISNVLNGQTIIRDREVETT
ncbi:PREDICTED: uncharacterized protein LOC104759737 [Camelina sativa]|uniref:Uncharacterized protein LOC104759737 n=1 Tax=Camelina sativa TaxID=90675 RepID=A0ABM0X5A6_CAMSA|nr:PREDICTED: uncharacterized protein LOC104759737 [Camelina sativa]